MSLMLANSELAESLLAPLSNAVLFGLVAPAVALWFCVHIFLRPGASRWVQAMLFPVRALVGCGALWLILSAMARKLVLATSWSLWTPALLGAVAAESIIVLYRLERRTVSRRIGLVLVALRVVAAILIAIMLAQPVFSRDIHHVRERVVAVIVDESASMKMTEAGLRTSERLRLARMFSVEAARPAYAFDEAAQHLSEARQKLAAQSAWLDLLGRAGPAATGGHLQVRCAAMKADLDRIARDVGEQIRIFTGVIAAKPPPPKKLKDELTAVNKALAARVQAQIAAAGKCLADDNPDLLARQYNNLIAAIRSAGGGLTLIIPRIAPLVDAIEETRFARLTAVQHKEIDAVVSKTRLAIARSVLCSAKSKDTTKLIDELGRKYKVKAYRFATQPTEINLAQWSQGLSKQPPSAPAPEPVQQKDEAAPQDDGTTDLVAAIEKVLADVPDSKLAGIVLLSDGRHNSASKVADLAMRMGNRKVPVCSVLIGGTLPPPDAAIIDVDAPPTVQIHDKVLIKVRLKLDGLKGRKALVRLSREGKVVGQKTVSIPSEAFRTEVELADTPKQKGLQAYRIDVQKYDTEAIKDNNVRYLHVAAVEDRTALLLIEDRPRWEFRYIKNLFASRDASVRLQHVLLRADTIQGIPRAANVHASVSRKVNQTEATALPKTEEEWMKFDVIILGDVAPEKLSSAHINAIKNFVSKRAGTLVIIAGDKHMPRSYIQTPLADLFPVVIKPAATQGTSVQGFRIVRTDAGRNHVIMRQNNDSEVDRHVWSSFRKVYWRHPVVDTKPGATVLAFAMPESPPDIFLSGKLPKGLSAEELVRRRQEFQRKNPLIVTQRYAGGRVLMMCFDRTWRFRYDVGDAHHHKFWGQVLRWAAAEKLQVGTKFVRLGTDKLQYAPGETVNVSAKIKKTDSSPLVDGDVAVDVYDGNQLVLRKKLNYIPDSSGIYQAELVGLPAGRRCRIELAGVDVKSILSAEAQGTVKVDVAMLPIRTVEMVELAADPGDLETLARASGGTVTDPLEANSLVGHLQPGTKIITTQDQYLLWDSWPFLLTIVAVLTGEWFVRKQKGMT